MFKWKFHFSCGIILLLFSLKDCASYTTSNSAGKAVNRSSCISFDIPTITLTSAQTAAERQLLGQDIQVEPDGWMITSFQSTVSSAGKKADNLNELDTSAELRRYYVEKEILNYYEDSIQEYQTLHILGEGYDGKLRVLPLSIARKDSAEERIWAQEIAAEVNRSRQWIYEYHLKNVKTGDAGLLREVQAMYLHSYFLKAKDTTKIWIYTSEKKWSLTP